jgi:hypothetical protein
MVPRASGQAGEADDCRPLLDGRQRPRCDPIRQPRRSFLGKLSHQLLVLNTRQQFNVAGRHRAVVGFIANCYFSAHEAVGVHEPGPFCLKLVLCLLFVVYAPLYRRVHAGLGIERRSAVDLAAARNIEFGRRSAIATTNCDVRMIIENCSSMGVLLADFS